MHERCRSAGASMNNPFSLHPHEVTEKAQEIRKKVLNMNYKAGQGHTGADLSEADILASILMQRAL